jgi:hypothetical protein
MTVPTDEGGCCILAGAVATGPAELALHIDRRV